MWLRGCHLDLGRTSSPPRQELYDKANSIKEDDQESTPQWLRYKTAPFLRDVFYRGNAGMKTGQALSLLGLPDLDEESAKPKQTLNEEHDVQVFDGGVMDIGSHPGSSANA